MCADLAAEYRATLDKLLEKERALVQALEGEPSGFRAVKRADVKMFIPAKTMQVAKISIASMVMASRDASYPA